MSESNGNSKSIRSYRTRPKKRPLLDVIGDCEPKEFWGVPAYRDDERIPKGWRQVARLWHEGKRTRDVICRAIGISIKEWEAYIQNNFKMWSWIRDQYANEVMGQAHVAALWTDILSAITNGKPWDPKKLEMAKLWLKRHDTQWMEMENQKTLTVRTNPAEEASLKLLADRLLLAAGVKDAEVIALPAASSESRSPEQTGSSPPASPSTSGSIAPSPPTSSCGDH